MISPSQHRRRLRQSGEEGRAHPRGVGERGERHEAGGLSGGVPRRRRTSSLTLPLAVFAAYLAIAAWAVFFTRQRADHVMPQGLSAQFLVTGVPSGISRDDLIAWFEHVVADDHVNLYLWAPDLSDPDKADLYALVGDRSSFEATFPGGVYPSFSRASPVALRDIHEVGATSLTGYYFGEAKSGRATVDLEQLRQAGWRVNTVSQGPPPRLLRLVLMDRSLAAALIVTLLASALAGLAFGSAQAQAAAVRQALGQGRAVVGLADHTRLLAGSAGLYGVGLVLAAAGLKGYNGFHQGWGALGDWSILAGLGALAAQAGLAVYALASGRLPVARRLRGARPRLLVVGSVACLAATWLVALPCLSWGVTTAGQVLADRHQDDLWWRARDLVQATISGATDEASWADVNHQVGQVVRQLVPDDGVVLSQPVHVVDSMAAANSTSGKVWLLEPRTLGPRFPVGTWLNVNQAWLRRNPLLGPDGQPVGAPAPTRDRAVIFVPPSRAALAADYEAAVRVEGQANRGLVFPDEDPATPFDVVTVDIAQQDVFTINAAAPVLGDCVVVMFSDDLQFGASWTAILSQGSLFFRDDAAFRQALDQSGLSAHLSTIEPVASAGLAAAAERRS